MGVFVRVFFAVVLLSHLSLTAYAIHREDTSKFFLYIEPRAQSISDTPVDDELTKSLELAFSQAKQGTADYENLASRGKQFKEGGGYRGMHFVEDGQVSTTCDYLLPNGFITNSCCVHYVRYYRDSLPETELKKLHKLHEDMLRQGKKSDGFLQKLHKYMTRQDKSAKKSSDL
mmetsp:Transcript_9123/g.15209  ORF Transcript_9123/g.15209 Transcript_9123/m.15209 type:complete len:173 (+) Transcript_9123:67-585(+)|eukprot:CAMPEP_0119010414 /NCGR_PEP_ID=MMETSP1176-20130426/4995_1 /TAXON_ID=265551 /ORGANISM="Synedropsis recta cf, Strain CCMP1620" /LENGTH=172 /DNA_ID=CAMNT_0006963067 /DNA_START=63 /DNA_END=581 /DNA_ORIENTATION=-